jgi:hypothetical protein
MSSILHLKLQPDRIPITNPIDWATASEQFLLVSPGEKSQMTLHLYNPLNETVEIELEVGGSFPQEWCRWNLEGRELRCRETMLVGIYFDVPPNWLETQPLNESLIRTIIDAEKPSWCTYDLYFI